MSRKLSRVLALILSIMLFSAMFIGCDKKDEDKEIGAGDKQEEEKPDKEDKADKDDKDDKEDEAPEDSGKVTDKPVTLTYWANMDGQVASQFDSLGEVVMYKELEKITGVEIDFLHPPAGESAGEHLDLLIATEDLPDLIEREWHNWPGGPEKAIEDEIIIELNDFIDEHAPNLKKVLAENDYLDKSIRTDNGVYTAFPFAFGHESLEVYRGPIMRKDWLDELGLEIPTTIDDWYTILRSFKENKDAPYPYTVSRVNIRRTGNIVSAYGALYKEFFNDDGQAKYGPAQPGYKDYLQTMNQWYQEELLDREYATNNDEIYREKILGGQAGAFVHLVGGGIKGFLDTMAEEDPSFDLVGVPYPTLEEGQVAMYGQRASTPQLLVAITTSCEEKEVAVKWLDYGYGDEGHMLFNFGVEGEGYDMIDGYPTYTKDITDNPDGLSMQQGLAKHCRGGYRGPYIKDKRYFEQYITYDAQAGAVEEWAKADGSTQIPLLYPTTEESERFAEIMDEITPYVREMSEKFIAGEESLEKFDEFIAEMNKMGLEEAISIQQSSLERFYNR